jgi:uncharacterized coiled-coil DUF342 family protein
MEFIGTIANAVFLIAAAYLVRDYLIGLRSDVAITRADVQAASKEMADVRTEANEQAREHHEALTELVSEVRELREEVEGDVPREAATANTPELAELLTEVRELRTLVKEMARFNLATGELVKSLVVASQAKST